MLLSQKVPNLTNICGVAIDLSAYPVPSYSGNNQNFYDSYLASSNSQSVYYGKQSVRFKEVKKDDRAGDYWEISMSLQFPSTDKERALRLEEFRKARFVILQLSNNLSMILGRNDYFQNARPKIKIESDEQLTAVQFTWRSIVQTGFLPDYNEALLPHSVPVNLLNAN